MKQPRSPNRPSWRQPALLPDLAIRTAADQFEEARRVLWNELTPEHSILLPALNVAAVTIQLYLRALGGNPGDAPEERIDGLYTVHSYAGRRGHECSALFDSIVEEIREEMQRAFLVEWPGQDGSLVRDLLVRVEELLESSRHAYERPENLSMYSLSEIGWLCEFLSRLLPTLPQREWKDR